MIAVPRGARVSMASRRAARAVVAGLLVVSPVVHAEPPRAELVIGQREPIAIVLVTRAGNVSDASRASLLRALESSLSRSTNLSPRVLPQALVSACRGEIGCTVDGMRTSKAAGDRATREADYLLLLSYLKLRGPAEGDPARLTLALIDAERAREYWTADASSAKDRREAVEARIGALAVLARPEPVIAAGDEDAAARLASAIEESFAPFFRKTGNWGAPGRIELRSEVDGVAVSSRGRPIGSARAPLTTITVFEPASVHLRLEHPAYEPNDLSVDVCAGCVVEVRPELEPATAVSALRGAAFWGGIAAIAAGASLGVYALAGDHGGVYCVSRPGRLEDECSARTLATFGGASAGGDASGVAIAPLGLGLLVAGGSWLGGTLATDETDIPWYGIAVGLVAGAAGLTAGALLGAGSSPN